ncbi:MAG TPA: hypothetical protein VGS41_18925, partial [Chthonomonadales bacterium]|nr:hypothetical protein [Chthonomonadales bacterium]
LSLPQESSAFLVYALISSGDNGPEKTLLPKLPITAANPDACAFIALADAALGRSAARPVAALRKSAIEEGSLCHWKEADSENADDFTATCTAVRALLAAGKNDPLVPQALRWLMTQRTGDYWDSTEATSWALQTFCDYLKTLPPQHANGSVEIELNGKSYRQIGLTPDVLKGSDVVIRIPAALLQQKNDLTFRRISGDSTVFYSVSLRQTIETEDIPAQTGRQIPGLSIARAYFKLIPAKSSDDDSWDLKSIPVDGRMKVGDNIRVRLTIRAPRDLTYVMIEDPFPAGCHVSDRGDADDTSDWQFWWSDSDVRDDRISFFATDLPKGEHVLEYNLHVQTPGSYHTLPAVLQGMYFPEAHAETGENRIEVRE